MKTLRQLAPWTTAALLLGTTSAQTADRPEDALAATTYEQHVDAEGGITRPDQARGPWAHLAPWVVADRQDPGHGFHDAYTQPEAARAWRSTGVFPDGTVLVKEIRALEEDRLTTGLARWAGEVKLWFVTVRDAERRFPGHPHWGGLRLGPAPGGRTRAQPLQGLRSQLPGPPPASP